MWCDTTSYREIGNLGQEMNKINSMWSHTPTSFRQMDTPSFRETLNKMDLDLDLELNKVEGPVDLDKVLTKMDKPDLDLNVDNWWCDTPNFSETGDKGLNKVDNRWCDCTDTLETNKIWC